MTRARQLLPLATLALLAACGAPGLDATARYGFVDLDGGVLTDTTVGAAENTWDGLGLDDTEATPGATVDLKWGSPHLSISTQQSGYSGQGVLNSEIEIDGDTIAIGTTVDADVDIDVTSALLTWDLAPGDLEFGLGLGIVGLGLDMQFADTGSSTVVASDETLPLPVLAARLGMSQGPWSLAGTLAGFDIDIDGDELSFFDFDAYGKYSFAGGDERMNAAVVVGYRSTDLSVDYEDGPDRVDADLELTGPYIGLRLSF